MSTLTPAEIRSLDDRFGKSSTADVLAWAWERFGARAAIGTSFQGAGLVMMHLAKMHGLPGKRRQPKWEKIDKRVKGE